MAAKFVIALAVVGCVSAFHRRQAPDLNEYYGNFNKFQEGFTKPMGGNFPTMPSVPGGGSFPTMPEVPFTGSSSSSSAASGSESSPSKRQAPDLNEYYGNFNKFQEGFTKPMGGNFPTMPSVPGGGSFPTMPEVPGGGSFPTMPEVPFTGSSSSSAASSGAEPTQSKRQAPDLNEYYGNFNKFQEGFTKPMGGNFPTMPSVPGGGSFPTMPEVPFTGSSSSSSAASGSESSPSKRQAPDLNEYYGNFNKFQEGITKPMGGNFPTMPSVPGGGSFPTMPEVPFTGSSSSSSAASGSESSPSKRQAPDLNEYYGSFNKFQEGFTKPMGGNFPTMPSGGGLPSVPSGGSFPTNPFTGSSSSSSSVGSN